MRLEELEIRNLLAASVWTDKNDYAPGDTAVITAADFQVGETVEFQVLHNDGVPNTGGGHEPWQVVDGGPDDLDGKADGYLLTTWYVNPDDSADSSFDLTATGLSSGKVATHTFTDAAGQTNKVYQHWADANGPEWNNNILNDNKSDYFEGEVIPHVFVYKASNQQPLTNGATYSINVTYNYYQQNTNAGGFLHMTTYNISRSPGPNDATNPYIAPTIDSTFTNGGGMQGSFYTVDANITNVSGVTYLGTGTKDGYVTITFVYTGTTTTNGIAEIYYGLQIAQPNEVPDQGAGPTDGAKPWTGGSLQTTVDINGSGATSIQLAPNAILRGRISGMKFNDLNNNGIKDNGEPGLAGWTIYLDTDNDGVLDPGEKTTVTGADGSYYFSVTPDGDKSDPDNDPFYVKEVNQNGWVQTTPNPAGILITAADPTETNVNFGNFLPAPSFTVEKTLESITGGTIDMAGDIVEYQIVITNTGNVDLTDVTLDDSLTDLVGDPVESISTNGVLNIGETWTYTYSYEVQQSDITPEIDLADFEAMLPTEVDLTAQSPGGVLQPSYFDIILSSTTGGTIPLGLYDGWCIDLDHTMPTDTPLTANVFSSYSDLPDGLVDNEENLDLVNWILNQDFVGLPAFDLLGSDFGGNGYGEALGSYTGDDVQRAIWILLDDIGSEDPTGRADEIVAAALEHDGFVPGCDGVIGMILQPVDSLGVTAAQVTFVEIGIPCEEHSLVNTVVIDTEETEPGEDSVDEEINPLNQATWSLVGPATIKEGGKAVYRVSLDGHLDAGQDASIVVSLANLTTNSDGSDLATEDEFDAAVSAAVAAYASLGTLSYDSVTNTITFVSNGSPMDPLLINLTSVNDTLVEGSEDFQVSLSGPGSSTAADIDLGASSATTTIYDTIRTDRGIVDTNLDAATWSIASPGGVNEGAAADYVVSLGGTMQAGEDASVVISFSNITTNPDGSDLVTEDQFDDAVDAAVAAYAGSGDLSYDSTTNKLTFVSAGAPMTALAISLTSVNDTLVEGNESFSIALSSESSTTGADVDIGIGLETTTIRDTIDPAGANVDSNLDAATWSLAGTAAINEGATASYTVSLSGTMQAGEDASVVISLTNVTTNADGSDLATEAAFDAVVAAAVGAYGGSGSLSYDSGTNTLTFVSAGAAMSSVSFDLTAVNDALVEGSETYKVSLSGVASTTGADVDLGASSVTTTIRDTILPGGAVADTNYDAATWSISGSTGVNEGAAAVYTLSLDGEMQAGENASVVVKLTYVTAKAADMIDETAWDMLMKDIVNAYNADNADSTPGSLAYIASTNRLTFTSDGTGEMGGLTINLTPLNDDVVEGNETYKVALSSVSTTTGADIDLGPSTVTTTIFDTIVPTDPVADANLDAATWSIAGPSEVNEGSPAVYTITLAGQLQAAEKVSVVVSLTNLTTALNGSDLVTEAQFDNKLSTAVSNDNSTPGTPGTWSYNTSTNTLTFTSNGNETTRSLSISLTAVANDDPSESDESFRVALASPSSTTGADADLGASSVDTTIHNIAPLMLDGEVGDGAGVLSEAQLDRVVQRAIRFWAQHGATGDQIAQLQQTDLTITDLAGGMLAGTDGQQVWVDSDAAGHGWSSRLAGVLPGRVDLLSTVVHEFGHLLGLDHDHLDADLAVGERSLPATALHDEGPANSLPTESVDHLFHWLGQSEDRLTRKASRIVDSLPHGQIAALVQQYVETLDDLNPRLSKRLRSL